MDTEDLKERIETIRECVNLYKADADKANRMAAKYERTLYRLEAELREIEDDI